jgi:hypothetical protein
MGTYLIMIPRFARPRSEPSLLSLEQRFLLNTNPTCAFAVHDLRAIDALLIKDRHAWRSRDKAGGVSHCLWQMARFARLARAGKGFRGAQFGLCLGRAQELLDSHGGAKAWWGTFGPLVRDEDWAGVQSAIELYLDLFELDRPPAHYLNRE